MKSVVLWGLGGNRHNLQAAKWVQVQWSLLDSGKSHEENKAEEIAPEWLGRRSGGQETSWRSWHVSWDPKEQWSSQGRTAGGQSRQGNGLSRVLISWWRTERVSGLNKVAQSTAEEQHWNPVLWTPRPLFCPCSPYFFFMKCQLLKGKVKLSTCQSFFFPGQDPRVHCSPALALPSRDKRARQEQRESSAAKWFLPLNAKHNKPIRTTAF